MLCHPFEELYIKIGALPFHKEVRISSFYSEATESQFFSPIWMHLQNIPNNYTIIHEQNIFMFDNLVEFMSFGYLHNNQRKKFGAFCIKITPHSWSTIYIYINHASKRMLVCNTKPLFILHFFGYDECQYSCWTLITCIHRTCHHFHPK